MDDEQIGTGTALVAPLTGRKAAFVAHYVMGSNGKDAAVAAGYSANTAKSTAWRLLHRDQAVMAAVRDAQAAVRAKAEITTESMLEQLKADREFAMECKQPVAAVRASEIQAKLAGLLVDRMDMRAAHAVQVQIVRFGDGGDA
jgi:phage terminase small subunit